jgi:hypothetical protein
MMAVQEAVKTKRTVKLQMQQAECLPPIGRLRNEAR